MLGYIKHLVVDYLHQDDNVKPSHDLYQLFTSEHIETFQTSFSALEHTLDDIEEEEEEEEEERDVGSVPAKEPAPLCTGGTHRTTVPPLKSEMSSSAQQRRIRSEEVAEPRTSTLPRTEEQDAHHVQPRNARMCDSPTRSDEGYGSFSGESLTDRHGEGDHQDDSAEEIAALGIIEEGDEVPDYGVSLEPVVCNTLSPRRSPITQRALGQGATPTKRRLAELSAQVPRVATARSGMSDNARNLLSIGYALSLMGEKLDKPRDVEGSVKSMIMKATQAIEKSQAGSVYGKSRYGGGTRYGGSKFGGSKRSVAKSIALEETLPAWGFYN